MVASMAVLVVMEIDKLVVMMAAKMIFFYFLMVDMKLPSRVGQSH